jgi:beta-lactamase class A
MNASALADKLRARAAEFSGQVGLVVRGYRQPVSPGDRTEVEIAIAPELVMPSCSLIKVPILWALLEEIEAGRLGWDQQVILREEDKAGSRGILKELHAGLALTIRDLAMLMVVLSDNTATNLLLDRVSSARVNETCENLGLTNTVLARKMMDKEARAAGRENLTTPLDCARLLDMMIYRERLSKASHDVLLDILLRQQLNDLLPFLMPDGTRFAHKSGELPGFRHDMGLLILEDWLVSISAMTHWENGRSEAVRFLNNIGGEVYVAFTAAASPGVT